MNDISQIPTEELLRMLQGGVQTQGAPQLTHSQIAEKIANDPISQGAMAITRSPFDPLPNDPNLQAAIKKGTTAGIDMLPQWAYNAGGKVTDFLAQHGAPTWLSAGGGALLNTAMQGAPMALTSASPAQPGSFTEAPARWMMKTAVKPSAARNTPEEIRSALDTMLQNGTSPTIGSMTRNRMAAYALNKPIDDALAASAARVPVSEVTKPAEDLFWKYSKQVNPQADMNAVENAIQQFKVSPGVSGGDDISAALAHELKKGTYQALGSKSYGEMGSAATEAQKQLARGLREAVATAVPEVQAPLAEQAARMNVNDVAMQRALAQSNNNPLGLAALRFDDPASAIAFLADRSAPLKSAFAHGLYSLGNLSRVTPAALAAEQYIRSLRQGQ